MAHPTKQHGRVKPVPNPGLEDAVKMYRGEEPYNKGSNPCVQDAYFYAQCVERFGNFVWEQALTAARLKGREVEHGKQS